MKKSRLFQDPFVLSFITPLIWIFFLFVFGGGPPYDPVPSTIITFIIICFLIFSGL